MKRDDLCEMANRAERYAKLAILDDKEDKPEMKGIVSQMADVSPVEMAYFCQQVVSYVPSVHLASHILIVFANRLNDLPKSR